jgi:hypothetical protein
MGPLPGSGDAELPQLFGRWVDELLPGPIPNERSATCDQCAMLAPSQGAEPGADYFFSPSTKCCTYLPEMANFLVGGVLADDDPAAAPGRASIEERIAKGHGVSPIGLLRTPVHALLYNASPASFGHARSMRCPHYLEDGGRCGIWRHRESTCATWFCKYNRGSKGRAFWNRLHDLLSYAEDALRTHCLVEVGLDAELLAVLFPPHALLSGQKAPLRATDVDQVADAKVQKARWGRWLGKERELYLACTEVARHLAWADVERLGGARLRLLTKLLRESFAEHVAEAAPKLPRQRQLHIVNASGDSVLATGYSAFDPLRMPKPVVEALRHFDGRPTAEALDAIEADLGVALTPGTVRKLVDFEILQDDADRTSTK